MIKFISKRLFYIHLIVAAWALMAIVFSLYKNLHVWTIALNMAVIAWNFYNIKKITYKI